MGILVGVAFFFIGLGGLFFSSNKKWLFIIFLIIGSWLVYIFTIGPLAESNEKLDSIINIDSKTVREIILKPTKKDNGQIKSIVKSDLNIQSRSSIETICKALNEAEYAFAGYLKTADSLAVLEIRMDSGKILFGIRKKGNSTALNVYSNGESGWNYGTLKCNDLGNVIKELIEK